MCQSHAYNYVYNNIEYTAYSDDEYDVHVLIIYFIVF